MTTVLIADKFEKVGVDGLTELGCTVVLKPELTTADLPIKQVAQQSGFRTVQHLTAVFRRFIGTTPATYRYGMRFRSGGIG
jgi:hypothetical protein